MIFFYFSPGEMLPYNSRNKMIITYHSNNSRCIDSSNCSIYNSLHQCHLKRRPRLRQVRKWLITPRSQSVYDNILKSRHKIYEITLNAIDIIIYNGDERLDEAAQPKLPAMT